MLFLTHVDVSSMPTDLYKLGSTIFPYCLSKVLRDRTSCQSLTSALLARTRSILQFTEQLSENYYFFLSEDIVQRGINYARIYMTPPVLATTQRPRKPS